MRKFTLLFVLLISGSLYAQHCPFDNMAILVVSPQDTKTGERIKNADITIRNGLGVIQRDFAGDLLRFVPNPDRIDMDMKTYQFKRIRYSFAGEDYILPLPWDFAYQKLYLYVEPKDGRSFNQTIIPLEAENYFDLHGNVGWGKGLFHQYTKETPPPIDEFDHTIQVMIDRKL